MLQNPFNVTKSVDLTDEEIHTYWVDFSGKEGFVDLVKPKSPMPMFILGSKGSGKTHVMRYMSYPLQRIRYGSDILSKLEEDGYVGLYMRCSGLNSARFQGKGQTDDAWDAVFAFQFEIWLGQIVLETAINLLQHDKDTQNEFDKEACKKILDLFDVHPNRTPTNLSELLVHLRESQRAVDVIVNNAAISQELPVKITLTPGRLLFGIPKVLSEIIPCFKNVNFLYLVDEFENLTVSQQRHLNTLIRERENPCSFRIGARLYGIRTFVTNNADELNKEDSEYEVLELDKMLRKNFKDYKTFATKLVLDRLKKQDYLKNDSNKNSVFLDQAFEVFDTSGLMESSLSFINNKYSNRERPYFQKLRDYLNKNLDLVPGIDSPSDVEKVIHKLSFPDFPILEKMNIFILYQKWKSGSDLLITADSIRDSCKHFAKSQDSNSEYGRKYQHFRLDLLAQLLRECDQKQVYTGANTFIDMSWGIPRNLLVLFKNIFSWATFKGESPFTGGKTSISAQTEGVSEAANWFYRDARTKGEDGKAVQDSVERLGTLFRAIRYSPKPSECELTTFSYDTTTVSDEANHIIDIATKWSLLIDIGNQFDRNSDRVDRKLQINRMIVPRWGLSLSSRGAIALTDKEINIIFSFKGSESFNDLLKTRVERMTPPLFGKKSKNVNIHSKPSLFDGIDLND